MHQPIPSFLSAGALFLCLRNKCVQSESKTDLNVETTAALRQREKRLIVERDQDLRARESFLGSWSVSVHPLCPLVPNAPGGFTSCLPPAIPFGDRPPLSAIFSGQALTAQYEKATVSAGCTILAGCLAGCGGGILADLLRLVCSQSL